MKRLLSSFLIVVMFFGILTGMPIAVNAADIETLIPDRELNLSWSSGTKYVNVSVDETGFYDVAMTGNASYGKYDCYISDGNTGSFLCSNSTNSYVVEFPYTYKNIYLEKGVDYTLEVTCYDTEYESTQGNISFLLSKNDYTVKALSSTSQKLIVDENEIHWFTIETQTAGDYWIDFGGDANAIVFDYATGEIVTVCYYGFSTVNLQADKKYQLRVYYQSANPQPVYVSCGKQEKTIEYVELYNSVCLADDYLNEYKYSYDYLVTYTDGSYEIVNCYYFDNRGVYLGLSYAGEYTDENEYYKSVGDQPVFIYWGESENLSYIYVRSYVDFVSELSPACPYDNLYIEYENTEYQQYFWRVNVDENNKYDLYSTQWNDGLFEWYSYEIFDKNNNAIPYVNGGYNLKAGEEYALMFEYRYAEDAYDDFVYSLDPLSDHGDHTHSSSEWIVDKEATVYSKGSKHKECTDCGAIIKTAEIPQLKASKPKLKTIANTEYGVKITWGKVKGADSYRVYRKTSKTDWEYIGSTSKTGYTDKTAKSGTKYYYAVRARNEAGNSSLSSSLSKYYLADPTMKTPSSTKNGVKLTWTKTSGSEGYMVYRKTGSGSYSKIATVKGSTKVTYTDKSAKKGKTYTYKVKAYKSKTYSAYSNTKTIKDKY